MKKIILTYFLSSIYLNLFSQVIFKPQSYVGINGGVNISANNISSFDSSNPDLKREFGISFKHRSEKKLGIQIEFNYVEKGWQEKYDTLSIYKRNLNYFQIPFMTQLDIGTSNFGIIAHGGPYFSYLISENELVNLSGPSANKDYYRAKLNNKFDFGVCLGIGVVVKSTIGHFQLEGRYSQGFINILNPDSFNSFTYSNNLALKFSFSYFYLIHTQNKTKNT